MYMCTVRCCTRASCCGQLGCGPSLQDACCPSMEGLSCHVQQSMSGPALKCCEHVVPVLQRLPKPNCLSTAKLTHLLIALMQSCLQLRNHVIVESVKLKGRWLLPSSAAQSIS
eukprot:5084574-Amphidinium_carterae.1